MVTWLVFWQVIYILSFIIIKDLLSTEEFFLYKNSKESCEMKKESKLLSSILITRNSKCSQSLRKETDYIQGRY
jgi:hypothetical protein